MNKFKKAKKKEQPAQKSNRFYRSLVPFFSGDFLSKDNVVNSLPYIFFLTFLGILYIANGYHAEKTVRQLNKVSNELKELRSEYITLKSDLNFQSKQSQVAQAIAKHGIKESIIPPSKIIISKKMMKKIGSTD